MTPVAGVMRAQVQPPCVAFISTSFDLGEIAQRVAALRPDWRLRRWPEPGFEEADVAVCWDSPAGVYTQMPRLRLIHGVAAGIDNIVAGHVLGDLPVCRIVDDDQANGMAEYVLWGVIGFHRRLADVAGQHQDRVWKRPPYVPAAHYRVGVMGLGALGAGVAATLAGRGYPVRGWSRSPKHIDGVEGFAGADALSGFLSGLDVLVCLLPLTPETRGILNRRLFAQLPRGAALIHAGRGEHLVASDLHEALVAGQLQGAMVDVFAVEPLPPDDPLWRAPSMLVTPHMATRAQPEAIAAQIVANVERQLRGQPLVNRVNVAAGY